MMKTLLTILLLAASATAQKPATTPKPSTTPVTTPSPATPVTPAPVTLTTPSASPVTPSAPLQTATPKGGVKINRAEKTATPEYRLVHDGPKVISLFPAKNLTLTKYTIERCPTKQACLDLATANGWTVPGPVLQQSMTPSERQAARAQVNAARQAKAQAARADSLAKAQASRAVKIAPKTTPPVNVSVPPR